MKEFETIQIKTGVRLHLSLSDKFKTNYISFTFHRPLSDKEVTVNSLLSTVIPRNCKSYPDTSSLNKRFDELYGTHMHYTAGKKGESHLLSFSFEFVNEKYIDSNQNLLSDIVGLAKEIVFDHIPFNNDYVEQEKENLRTLILSVLNDKRVYAQVRLFEEMFKNEPYGIPETGRIKDLPAIDADTLYKHYKEVILSSPLDIFFAGNITRESVVKIAENLASFVNVTESYPAVRIMDSADEVKTVIEHENVAQAKLAMGFRIGGYAECKDEYAVRVYNHIFGGGPYSRLFNNVREKMSLCYYVSSRMDRLKGIMCVNAGIECDKFEVARDAILEQERIVRTGGFTDEELEAAKLSLVDSLRSILDSQRGTELFCMMQLMSGSSDGLKETIDAIMSVTRERIIAAAENVRLDTVYLLTKED